MIVGFGIDMVSVPRIERALSRSGERLPLRVLRPREFEIFLQRHSSPRFLASRFAVREAAAKAFGTGIGARLGWRDMELRHDALGAPALLLHGRAIELAHERGVSRCHLSLSDEGDFVLAAVILEGGSSPLADV